MDEGILYQYQLLDAAVEWAVQNCDDIMPIACQREGRYKSYYLGQSSGLLESLVETWDCNSTRALHTALFNYLRMREIVLSEGQVNFG